MNDTVRKASSFNETNEIAQPNLPRFPRAGYGYRPMSRTEDIKITRRSIQYGVRIPQNDTTTLSPLTPVFWTFVRCFNLALEGRLP